MRKMTNEYHLCFMYGARLYQIPMIDIAFLSHQAFILLCCLTRSKSLCWINEFGISTERRVTSMKQETEQEREKPLRRPLHPS